MHGGFFPPVSQWQDWPEGNYVNPVTKPRYLLAFACLLGPISFSVLLSRLWVRIRIQRNPGWDDWVMVVSLFPVIAVTLLAPYATNGYYFNRHIWDIDPKHWVIQRKLLLAIDSLFCLACGLIKLSVVLFCRRLSSRVASPVFQKALRAMTVVISLHTIFFTFIPVFSCRPVAAFWNQVDFAKVADGYKYKCLNEGNTAMSYAVTATVQDFVVASLPTFLCWNLQISFREKVALFSILTFGYTTVLMGALRTWAVHQTYFTTIDVTWLSSKVWLFALLEMHIGATCTNSPALRVFFAHFLDERPWTGLRSRSQQGTHSPCGKDRSASPTRFPFIPWNKLPSWKAFSSRRNPCPTKKSSPKSQLESNIYTEKNLGMVQTTVQFVYQGKETDVEMGSVSEVEALPHFAPREPTRWEVLREKYRSRLSNVQQPTSRKASVGISSLGCGSESDVEALPAIGPRSPSRLSAVRTQIANVRRPNVRWSDVRWPHVRLSDVQLPAVHLPRVYRPSLRLPDVNLPDGWRSMRA